MNISKEAKEHALAACRDNNLKEAFVNEAGEVFTVKNLALLSVKGDTKKVATVNAEPVVTGDEDEQDDGDNADADNQTDKEEGNASGQATTKATASSSTSKGATGKAKKA